VSVSFAIRKNYNGLCVSIRADDRANDAESELFREFCRQHEESNLVLVPSGGYYNSTGESWSSWQIRKKHEPTGRIKVRAFWQRLVQKVKQ
jgi:hypothetical protein